MQRYINESTYQDDIMEDSRDGRHLRNKLVADRNRKYRRKYRKSGSSHKDGVVLWPRKDLGKNPD